MRPRQVFAIGLFLLFATALYFLKYDSYSIALAGVGILLGSALPDLDSLLKGYRGHLRVLVLLSAAFLIYLAWSGGYVICLYLIIPFCENLVLYALLLLTALFLVFDLMSPLKPPLHGLIPMALFTLAYSALLLYLRLPPAASFLSLCGFFLGYFGHVMGEALKLNPEE
ncbi:MAG: hypothetical protein AB1657_04340 [Candidatus Micrarchaeota archaeon]